MVIALLRLSSKYEVDELRRQTIKHLKLLHPDTYEEFLAFTEVNGSEAWNNFPIANEDDVITYQVAQETGLLRMLPTACYWMTINFFEGFLSEDELPVGSITWIQKTIDTLIKAASESVWKSLFCSRPFMCMNTAGHRCEDAISAFLSHKQWSRYKDDPDVFDPYHWTSLQKHLFPHICEICRDNIKNCMEKGRREVWEALPSYFGLGDWKTLKDSDVS